jgi:phosphoribosylaminoimidazolecarboxamide formyltransferase/IMP cyclohydrolase
VSEPLDAALAERLAERFVEVVVAPGFDDDALPHLIAKPELRLLAAPRFAPPAGSLELRALDGGFLAQTLDTAAADPHAWHCPTRRRPTEDELGALELAWAVVRHVKSNAIVIANRDQTVGIGAGQMSRVDSCRLAVGKAVLPLAGTAAASDAFFPFRDGLDVLAAAGVTAVVQPGGSKRDQEVLAAADERGLAMVLTGTRHFRH